MHLRIYERVKSTKILSSLHSPTSQVFPNISPQIIFFTKYISLFALLLSLLKLGLTCDNIQFKIWTYYVIYWDKIYSLRSWICYEAV